MNDIFKVQFLVMNDDVGAIVSTNSLYDILTKYRGLLAFKTRNMYGSHSMINGSAIILGVIQRNYNA